MTTRALAAGGGEIGIRAKRLARENGLSLAFGGLFLVAIVGQFATGWRAYDEELAAHGMAGVSFGQYLTSGHFLEALFENWESEFLQMTLFVVLTVKLRQRGSSEPKGLAPEPTDADPRPRALDPAAPWAVHRGGVVLRVYEHSLTILLGAMFLSSFVLHAVHGRQNVNVEQLAHGGARVTLLDYLTSSRFWFESFQNWQSELFAVLALVLASVWLRERGSPQSKPVAAPHHETGG
jgi:hypothetical protein